MEAMSPFLDVRPVLDRQLSPVLPPREASYAARLALDDSTRLDAYRMRYDSYLASGHIEPNPSRQFHDAYDALPNCQTVVIYDDDIPVASVRTCTLAFGSGQRSPAADVYPDVVDDYLGNHPSIGYGRRGIETTRLVRSPACENNQGLVFLLYRMAGYIGMMAHTQVLFACVRANHVRFYRRLGYSPAAEPRVYPGLNCAMQLMVCTRERYDQIRGAFPVIDPYTSATGSLDGFLSGNPVSLSLVNR